MPLWEVFRPRGKSFTFGSFLVHKQERLEPEHHKSIYCYGEHACSVVSWFSVILWSSSMMSSALDVLIVTTLAQLSLVPRQTDILLWLRWNLASGTVFLLGSIWSWHGLIWSKYWFSSQQSNFVLGFPKTDWFTFSYLTQIPMVNWCITQTQVQTEENLEHTLLRTGKNVSNTQFNKLTYILNRINCE